MRSVIVDSKRAISAQKRIMIYELAKQKEFQHPDKIWMFVMKKDLRGTHIAPGKKRKNKDRARIKMLVLNSFRGKPMIQKIADELKISYQTVWNYLNKEHRKRRDKYNRKNINKPSNLKITLNEKNKLKTRLWNLNSEDYQNEKKLEFSLDLLHNGGWSHKRRELKLRCDSCNRIRSWLKATNPKNKKKYAHIYKLNLCSRCRQSLINKEIRHNQKQSKGKNN
jgi:DNA-directed RNA polymerase alpha subunit